MNGRALKRIAIILLALSSSVSWAQVPAQPPAPRPERGVGPFSVNTPRGKQTVRLLRRDGNMVWVDQMTSLGQMIETGILTNDILGIEITRPRIFDTADAASSTDQVAQAMTALRRVSDSLKPFRDLPGVPVDESLFIQARLLERDGMIKEALFIYQDITKQPYGPAQTEAARLRQGLCLSKLGKGDEALAILDTADIPEDDQVLLSDVFFERAKARAAKGRHDEAIMDFLRLVVFEPYVRNNEQRCLEAVLPSYAAISDWDAVQRSIASLQKQYPDAEETVRAVKWAETYTGQLPTEEEGIPQ